ncbi:MAG: glycosyltransferase family 4 protein [Gammaproteobacteria bacterium]
MESPQAQTGIASVASASRVLVITELFLPTKGGTAVWFDEVYRRLGGKDLHIVTADVPGAAVHDASHPNSVHRVTLRRHWWLRPESLGMYLRLLGRSVFLAMGRRFDAVHAGRVLPEGLIGWLVAKMIRKPLVVYAHGEELTTWKQPGKHRVMTFVFQHADRVVANSEFTRQELLQVGVQQERISLIHPGVDVQRFRPGLPVSDLTSRLGLNKEQRLILSVGRLSRRKGFDQVIQALPGLVSRGIDAHYAIVGIGEDKTYLEGLAEQRNVGARVHLLGHVPMEELPRWYNAADVFAMPNREIDGDTEGFGMVYLEAAACGTPAIAGRAGGTSAAVVDGVTGVLVDGTSTQAVEAALATMLEDGEFAARIAEQARKRAREELSWEHTAELTVRLGIELQKRGGRTAD